jgi:hypothetical protein
MKLHYVSCKLLSILCAAGALSTVPAWAGSPVERVTAVLLPDGTYSPIAITEMGRETARILKSSGVALRWHLGATQVADDLLVVVRLRGRCDMDGSLSASKATVLGWSDEVDGRILPFSDLACDSIREFIQSARPLQYYVPANALLGRAMGRVLAHELYHIVADTASHGKDGVARPALSARELTTGQLNLRPPDVEAIRDGLRQMRH